MDEINFKFFDNPIIQIREYQLNFREYEYKTRISFELIESIRNNFGIDMNEEMYHKMKRYVFDNMLNKLDIEGDKRGDKKFLNKFLTS